MRFTVSILTYTALRQAKACIAAVLASPEPFKLILTANGNMEAAAYFQQLAAEFPHIRVVINPSNEGFIAPNRHALSLCNTEFFVMLNDDTRVPRDWLEKLAAPFGLYATAALSGPHGGCQTLMPSFHGTKGTAFEYLEGSCLCCKTEVVRQHGLFDPHLKWAYGEDSDLSLRMRELGRTLHRVEFPLNHEIGATSRHVKDVRLHQNANHEYLKVRWAHYLKVRHFGYPIIVKRGAAHGDVLLTTPILRALKERHPLSDLYVETLTPQIYLHNPVVKLAANRLPLLPNAEVINLDGSYEATPARHIIDSYAAKCGLENVGRATELYLDEGDLRHAELLMPAGEWVALHTGPSTWKSKEWPAGRFQEVITALRSRGLKTILVGSAGRAMETNLDQRARTTIHQMAAIIQRCRLFIGLDSLPLHCAEAVGTPAIGLFGITDPQYIITRPERTWGVCATAVSFGLRHRVPRTNAVDDGGAAMASITVPMVLDAVERFLDPKTPCPAIL